jgi:hypothetical protein
MQTLHSVRFISCTTQISIFSIFHMQYYPDDAELLNRSIKHFGWMKKLFGPVLGGFYRPNTYAEAIRET